MKERQIVFQAWMYRLNEIPVEEVAKQGSCLWKRSVFLCVLKEK